jgi:hypothetical protein
MAELPPPRLSTAQRDENWMYVTAWGLAEAPFAPTAGLGWAFLALFFSFRS